MVMKFTFRVTDRDEEDIDTPERIVVYAKNLKKAKDKAFTILWNFGTPIPPVCTLEEIEEGNGKKFQ